ncbi:TRAP transporter small permease [Neobacillus mesonae]|uniref:TRAP transporter small permease n=1 Tax=Neobacillus mesonae TaxID=1193713 RepID=UPI0020400207|nr:TRAP transporter small permease [Neobacillus mesonae]MCM3568504.1 TRAP transporter small permease [Neobacillus mesonae]
MSKAIAYIENTILAVTLGIMSILAFANVVSRYLFHYSISFTEEVTVNLFVLLTFLGAAAGIRMNAHLGFTMLFDKLSGVPKKALIILSCALISVIFLIFVYFGYDMVSFQIESEQKTPSLGWNQWVFTLGFPVGCLFGLYRAIEAGFREWKQVSNEESGVKA